MFWCILLHMRKRKYRKTYQVAANPVMYAIMGATVIDEDSLDQLRSGELMAIEAFRTGAATVQDWKLVSEFCNLAESMAQDGIGPEAMPAVKLAQQALIEAHERFVRTGQMGTSGPGLTAFRDVYQYHDLQRQSVARSVYEKHIERVYNKIRSKSPDVLFVNPKGTK